MYDDSKKYINIDPRGVQMNRSHLQIFDKREDLHLRWGTIYRLEILRILKWIEQ